MPRSLVMLVLMPVAGAFYNRLGPKVMIGSGLVIAGFAPIMMSRSAENGQLMRRTRGRSERAAEARLTLGMSF